MNQRRGISVLPAAVARKIAAGEVIERPASVVRELLDNSLDAEATEITVEWESGGLERVRVRDNGWGMSQSDLELCYKPHATSKVRSMEELAAATTLGFRGEAMASMAAVSQLYISSRAGDAESGAGLTIRDGVERGPYPTPMDRGTIVEVRRLFADVPARRKFISRPQTESRLITTTILEKALPFPKVAFRFGSNASKQTTLPGEPLVERVSHCFGNAVTSDRLHLVEGTGPGFQVRIVAADPNVVRRDRRMIQVYVNGRRVQEYRLIQAVQYAYTDVQHGGLFPVAAVLVSVEPDLADFNIHPAKREVRLRNSPEIRSRIVELLRSFLRSYVVKTVQFGRQSEEGQLDIPGVAAEAPHSAIDGGTYSAGADRLQLDGDSDFGPGRLEPTDTSGFGPGGSQPDSISDTRADRLQAENATHVSAGRARGSENLNAKQPPVTGSNRKHSAPPRDRPSSAVTHKYDRDISWSAGPSEVPLQYVGQLFDTFVIVERGDQALLIDQHAAHERLLYDRYRQNRTSQNLLVPEEFEVTEDQTSQLKHHADELGHLGISLEQVSSKRWRLVAAPAEYHDSLESLIEVILALEPLQEGFDREFLADMACKAAVKRGDYLDELSALDLARRTLALDTPRCPHGRPLWIELTRRELFRLIGRE